MDAEATTAGLTIAGAATGAAGAGCMGVTAAMGVGAVGAAWAGCTRAGATGGTTGAAAEGIAAAPGAAGAPPVGIESSIWFSGIGAEGSTEGVCPKPAMGPGAVGDADMVSPIKGAAGEPAPGLLTRPD